MRLHNELRAGVDALGLALQQSQHDQLLEFLSLLQKWNRTFNLTAIDEPAKMLTHHLLDSLAVVPMLDGANKVLDVGSGGGLPGIPFAIAMPECNFILLDSNAKKTRFIRQAIAHCGLKNVQVVQSRVQDYHAPDQIDFIVSRAFASLGEFCDGVAHLVSPKTRLLAMKAGLKSEEKLQLDSKRYRFEEQALQVPGIDEPRSLVSVTVL